MVKKTTAKKAVTTVYVGRSLSGLSSGTVFRGGDLPPHVAEIVKNNPHVSALIVPVEGLQEARKNMKTSGHILNFHAKKI